MIIFLLLTSLLLGISIGICITSNNKPKTYWQKENCNSCSCNSSIDKELKIESKNEKTLKSFSNYCRKNPEQRFWQALRNWSEYNFILGCMKCNDDINGKCEDTFYKE